MRRSLVLTPEMVAHVGECVDDARGVAMSTGIPIETIQSIRENRMQLESRRLVGVYKRPAALAVLLRRWAVGGVRLADVALGTGLTPYLAGRIVWDAVHSQGGDPQQPP
jgi:hypothetical protein